jgi:carbamate kinase
LAIGLGAQQLLLLTDVDAVHDVYGGPGDRAVRSGSAEAMRRLVVPAGSMGPKVEAACRFADAGGASVIGSLDRLPSLLDASSGTMVGQRFGDLEWWD